MVFCCRLIKPSSFVFLSHDRLFLYQFKRRPVAKKSSALSRWPRIVWTVRFYWLDGNFLAVRFNYCAHGSSFIATNCAQLISRLSASILNKQRHQKWKKYSAMYHGIFWLSAEEARGVTSVGESQVEGGVVFWSLNGDNPLDPIILDWMTTFDQIILDRRHSVSQPPHCLSIAFPESCIRLSLNSAPYGVYQLTTTPLVPLSCPRRKPYFPLNSSHPVICIRDVILGYALEITDPSGISLSPRRRLSDFECAGFMVLLFDDAAKQNRLTECNRA